MLEGLHYIHDTEQVIHSDIKLENILMQSPEREDEYAIPKICDFGLSLLRGSNPAVSPTKAYAEVKCGTAGYIAPEMIQVNILIFLHSQNTYVGPEIDIWSFGVCLYEMAVAYKPTQISNFRYGNFTTLTF